MQKQFLISAILAFAVIFIFPACAKRGGSDGDMAKSSAPAPADGKAQAQTPPADGQARTEAAPASQLAAETTESGTGRKLVRVSTINGIEANAEFQRNVQLVQAQRQNIINLNNQLESASDDEAKAKIQAQIDEALAKLNENNRKMLQTYGFSLTRNYMYVYEKAHIYMAVTDEEATKIQAAQQPGGEEGN